MIFRLLLLAAVVTGCALPARDVYTHNPPLSKNNLSNINGDYEAKAWKFLKAGTFFRKTNEKQFVRLTCIDSSTIKADLMYENKVFSTTRIRGHVDKDGYFAAKPRTGLIPIPLFFWFYNRMRSDLILTENHDLFVFYCGRSYGQVIFAAGQKGCSNHEFKRLK